MIPAATLHATRRRPRLNRSAQRIAERHCGIAANPLAQPRRRALRETPDMINLKDKVIGGSGSRLLSRLGQPRCQPFPVTLRRRHRPVSNSMATHEVSP